MKQEAATLSKNKQEIQRLKGSASIKSNLRIRLIVTLMTLDPFLLMSYVDGQRSSSVLTVVFNFFLPVIVPGYYIIFWLFYFSFIILFIYGIFSAGKESSYLYKLKIIQRINNKKEAKHRKIIAKLQKENRKLLNANDFFIIPPGYSHPEAISDLQKYLINKRAYSLREAIEIYELEEYRNRFRRRSRYS